MENCKCEGKYSHAWHRKWDIPTCERAKKLRSEERKRHRQRVRQGLVRKLKDDVERWPSGHRVGSSIYIPEYEAL